MNADIRARAQACPSASSSPAPCPLWFKTLLSLFTTEITEATEKREDAGRTGFLGKESRLPASFVFPSRRSSAVRNHSAVGKSLCLREDKPLSLRAPLRPYGTTIPRFRRDFKESSGQSAKEKELCLVPRRGDAEGNPGEKKSPLLRGFVAALSQPAGRREGGPPLQRDHLTIYDYTHRTQPRP